MQKKYSILIVEDHQINIDSYKRAFEIVSDDANIRFSIAEALNCDQAVEKMKAFKESNRLDLVILDINLPPSKEHGVINGETLGVLIKQRFPDCKLLVCTSHNDNLRLNSILKTLNPEAFLIKSDITFIDLISAITKLLKNSSYYSKTILNLMRKKLSQDLVLDELDVKILYEISNGARMKELEELVPLSKASIEKRKKNLKNLFGIKSNSDRELILTAKNKGFL